MAEILFMAEMLILNPEWTYESQVDSNKISFFHLWIDWLDPWVQPSRSGAGADFIQAMPGTTPTRKSIKMDNVNVSERGYVQEHWEKRDDGIVPQQLNSLRLLEYHLSLFGKMEKVDSIICQEPKGSDSGGGAMGDMIP